MIGLLLILINLYMLGLRGEGFLTRPSEMCVAALVEFVFEWFCVGIYLIKKES